jgi:Flp pilus assembly protein TadD
MLNCGTATAYSLTSRGQFDEAMNAFEHAMTLDPSFAAAIANLAKQRWRRRDLSEADRLYAEAVRVAEPSPPAWILSDHALFCDEGLDAPDRAQELHARAVEDAGYPLANARLAHFLMKRGVEIERANSLFAEALDKGNNDAEILFLAGRAALFYRGDRETARTRLEKACTLAPNDVRILRLTGDLCLTLGDGTSAAYYYRKAMNHGAPGWEIHAGYGTALLLDRKPDGAVRHLSRARRSAPQEPFVLTNLAAALWASRRNTDATALMREILSQPPPPEIEVEVLAMLRLAAPLATAEMTRLRGLISSGHRTDGATLRSMAWGKPKSDRSLAFRLADIIEGKTEFPPVL